ncbi:MAG TPA: glycosyltransferase family 39 protein [Gammaproteobacteria bacterium]|jgi:4-amino-4-deoxy-L-arabinose transferase-like glycosyltransferase|nr:glycosyltransferase family 39 protein [Gammaproteobacteria bacterium]
MVKLQTLTEVLWGNRAKVSYLFIVAVILLFTFLGAKDIWTQEHRWADIVSGMFYRQDFFHPYLGESRYYDKPLLSYWLIAAIAAIVGELTTWALRLPSALAGLLAVWSIYRLGVSIKDKQLGLLAGWLLISTFYFVFWARVSSADMLNLAGSLFAVSWYFQKRVQANFFDYAVFFIIIALTSLCKGLIGAIIPLIAVFADILLQHSWRQHLRWPLFLSVIPALIIYLLPFLISHYAGGETYGQNGLYMVYRENFLRYFQPFDHVGPLYTYFIYLPVYSLPAALFLLPALTAVALGWKRLSLNTKWLALTLGLLFLFFTISGSRRSYYVLPLVPFAILLIADWCLSATASIKRQQWAAGLVVFSVGFIFLTINLLPTWYYSKFGAEHFATQLRQEVNKLKPNHAWQVVMLDGESKLNFYLRLPPQTKNHAIQGERDEQTMHSLLEKWPVIKDKPENTIFISRQKYLSMLQPFFTEYHLVQAAPSPVMGFSQDKENIPIAFIPVK